MARQQPSTISQVLPLIIVFAILGVFAWVGYHIYLSVTKIQQTASERMGKKNVVFTKDGMRVGVKHRNTENYIDSTQSWVVKAWNLGTASNEEQEKSRFAIKSHALIESLHDQWYSCLRLQDANGFTERSASKRRLTLAHSQSPPIRPQ
ncbi:hypothetical protein BGZ63DRAFT_400881 [Mariannaea sp. PMI_226]|nr:hypothetical protein BGZ63DRAFT_400881 [Mariannaea sp. PMI_226]